MARCCRSGSTDADEERTRHFADVLATTVIVRYALSFDGLATKVNHHRTVSEYFTAPDQLKRNGFDRLIRLAVGLEDADDLIAALNWTLHHGAAVTAADIERLAAAARRLRWGSDTWAPPHISASSPASTTRRSPTLIPHYKELIDAAAAAVDTVARDRAGGRRSRHRLGRARGSDPRRCARRRG